MNWEREVSRERYEGSPGVGAGEKEGFTGYFVAEMEMKLGIGFGVYVEVKICCQSTCFLQQSVLFCS